jgi:FkbM family methyltransferase
VGASSILNRGQQENCVKIEKIIGDNFFEEQGLERLDFVKIDVEGHEKYALKGILKTIKKYRPIIMME